MTNLGSKGGPEESNRTSNESVTLRDQSFNGTASDARDGYRTKRAGYPSVDDQPLDQRALQARRTFIEGLASGSIAPSSVGIRGNLISLEQYITCGRLALRFVESLAQDRNGIRPTFYQVVAEFRATPGYADLNSNDFEVATRVLKSAWFSGEKLGPKLWNGSEKNLYDGIVLRFDDTTPAVTGMNLPGAIVSILRRETGKLVSSAEIATELGMANNPARASRLLSATFQLLSETGDIVRHPDHTGALDSVNAVAVWSDAQGPWIKPALQNPEQVVLAHAAKRTGGWLFELYSNSGPGAGPFSNHTIKEAAQRLADRGFLVLSRQFPAEGAFAPVGMRLYDHVVLTPEGERAVRRWSDVPVGGVLDDSNYEELRGLLITRTPLRP